MISSYLSGLAVNSIFGHKGTNTRFISLFKSVMDNFGKSIPQSCSTNAETEAAYHFLNSPRVMYQSIIDAERDRVVSEIKAIQLPVVLSIGDVTSLDYSQKRSSKNIGSVSSKNHKEFNVLSQLMCDGDVHEILQCRQYDHIHYIIRSKNDRKYWTRILGFEHI